MTEIAGLGYLGFEVGDLAAWQAFATDVLGLEAGARTPSGALPLRMDEFERRILLHEGPRDDFAYAGWQVRDEPSLRALADRLEAAGISVQEATAADAAERGVATLLRCADPNGNALELFVGPHVATVPFRSSRLLSGFVTGEQGLGHLVLVAKDLRETDRFYRGLLGLRLSDRIQMRLGGTLPVEIVFLHANPRHHSFAFAAVPLPKRMHHFMLELGSLDDVGRAYDRCLDAGVAIVQTLGRHPNDRMVSFYARTPSGFDVEIGWGARTVDDATWQERVYGEISEWGHRSPAP
jgi:biphenyl-2,3-diol 1,2-dioxygenase/3,4-dihydroxy-9,10-secoandrosta-1,3,5(10)-triene-9,17-dione 4,5-dioxygenase